MVYVVILMGLVLKILLLWRYWLYRFYLVDWIEANCDIYHIIDQCKFKIIRKSWNKTDKMESIYMNNMLLVKIVTEEFGIIIVYKKVIVLIKLREILSYYQQINRQISMLKNTIYAICVVRCGACSTKSFREVCWNKAQDYIRSWESVYSKGF